MKRAPGRKDLERFRRSFCEPGARSSEVPDRAGAIPELQKGIEMAPSVPTFHLELGVCLEKLRRLADAGREYQTYLDMAPAAPDVEKVRSHLQSLPRARS